LIPLQRNIVFSGATALPSSYNKRGFPNTGLPSGSRNRFQYDFYSGLRAMQFVARSKRARCDQDGDSSTNHEFSRCGRCGRSDRWWQGWGYRHVYHLVVVVVIVLLVRPFTTDSCSYYSMNRHSFLSSQPFLFALPSSSSWPPQITDDPSSCRREILLRDHFLSVEPLLTNETDALGPAFFIKSTDGEEEFDPAMCKFEFAIHTASKKTPSPKSKERTTPSRTPGTTAETKEFIGFFLIDERAYQVDLGKVKDVDLKMESDDTKPPSLVIQFSTCIFRIFSLIGIPADQFSVLNAAKTRILSLLIDYISTFPVSHPDIISPRGSSAHNSSEPGQKEIDISHETTNEHMMNEDTERDKLGESVEDCVALTQKCQVSYNQTREDLQTLRRLLEHSSAGSKQKQSHKEFRDTVSGLLNSMAGNMASSFCTRSQLSDAAVIRNEQINSYQSELEDILKTVWPNTRPKKRARLGDINGKTPSLPQPSESESMANIKNIMAKHRQLIRSKYALALLPTRG
jgi:hypothetical protein